MNQQQNLDIQTQKTDIYSWSKAHVIHHERSTKKMSPVWYRTHSKYM